LGAAQGQCDLSAGRRPDAAVQVRFPAASQRDDARFLRADGAGRNRADRGRHARGAGAKPDAAAFARLSANPVYNAQLHTTCVATMLQGGHAVNALPQLARAGVNCRVMPGEPIGEVKATLERVLADDQIKVTQVGNAVLSEPSKLNEEIVGAIEK